jgi:uncharacterized membrane protein
VIRLLRHLSTPRWILRWRFRTALLEQIRQRIGEIEQSHPGELRFVVEHALELGDLLDGVTPRQRALELFGLLRVWDTEHNNGVLVYVLHADHAVEIVADRGLARCVPQDQWDGLCREVETKFRSGDHAAGSLAAIEGAARILQQHAVPGSPGRNELPDRPLLL